MNLESNLKPETAVSESSQPSSLIQTSNLISKNEIQER